jgi:hypothetical protein
LFCACAIAKNQHYDRECTIVCNLTAVKPNYIAVLLAIAQVSKHELILEEVIELEEAKEESIVEEVF